jgi:site-specific recombinase XerD
MISSRKVRRFNRRLPIPRPSIPETPVPTSMIPQKIRAANGRSMKRKKPRKTRKATKRVDTWEFIRKDIFDLSSRWLDVLASEEIRSFHSRKEHPTIRAYKYCLATFWRWLKDYSPDIELIQIRKKDVNAFRDWMIKKKYSSRTIALKASGVSSFWIWLLDNEIFGPDYTYNPFSGIHLPGIPHRIPKTLTDEEDHKILESNIIRSHEEFYAAVLLMRFAGLRISETYDLEVLDVKDMKDTFEINIKHGKGNKQRTTFFFPYHNSFGVPPDHYIQLFRKYLESRSEKVKLFDSEAVNLRMFFTRLRKKGRIVSSFTPHRLRHTFATTLLRQGVSRDTLADLLGHESTATTKMYSQMTPELLKNKAFKEMQS